MTLDTIFEKSAADKLSAYRARLSSEFDEGICYPSEDGEPMAENEQQAIAMADTFSALRARFQNRADAYVGMDMFVYYVRGNPNRRIAPDVFVVFDAEYADLPRLSWNIWRERRSPDFVLEVLSPKTWRRDVGEKRAIYAEMKAGEYWQFNAVPDIIRGPSLLRGEVLVDGQYEPLRVFEDESGIARGYSPILGLDLCVRDSKLRLYDPDVGEWLRILPEEMAARRAAEQALRESESENRRLREMLRRLTNEV